LFFCYHGVCCFNTTFPGFAQNIFEFILKKSFIFAVSNKLNFFLMETAVMPRARRSSTFAKPKTARDLDAHFISLTNQIIAGKKPSLCFEQVEEALASGKVSPDVIDDLEDAMFGQIMEESRKNDDGVRVSRERITTLLRRR
jgi:hypothetical protein